MRAVRTAWVLVALTAAAAIGDTLLTAASHPLFTDASLGRHGWPMVPLAATGSALMGALILARYPRNPVGWMLSLSGFITSLSVVCEAYNLWVLRYGGTGPQHLAEWAGWLSALFGAQMAFAAITVIFLLAPDGRLPSRRSRYVLYGAGAGLVVYAAGLCTVSPSSLHIDSNVGYRPITETLLSLGILITAAVLVTSVVSLVRRLRRATGARKEQLRWVAAAAIWLAVGLVWLLVLGVVQDQQTWVQSMPLFLGYLALPVLIAVAVLRHRLYDIDVIVNRTVLVAVAGAFVAIGYVALVVLVGGNAGGFWPSLVATAVVAMAFQPLRVRAVRLADRLAYGERAVPYEALADFSRRLGESPHPSALLPAVAEAAAAASGARRTTVTLYVEGGDDHVATWPADDVSTGDPAGTVAVVPVADRGDRLGSIGLETAAGLDLRADDVRLVEGLATQAALAFRNARLTAELAGRVGLLRERAAELAESRRRLITAGDAERRRVEAAIGREVLPHLEPLPGRITALETAGPTQLASGVAALIDESGAALEALRDITRGVFPAQLERSGLGPALASHLGRTDRTARLDVAGSAVDRRFPAPLEAAAYFSVVEAARALEAPVTVGLAVAAGHLTVRVSGGGAGPAVGPVRDRVEAAGGSVDLRRTGASTVLEVRLPHGGEDGDQSRPGDPPEASQAAASRSGPNADLVR